MDAAEDDMMRDMPRQYWLRWLQGAETRHCASVRGKTFREDKEEEKWSSEASRRVAETFEKARQLWTVSS